MQKKKVILLLMLSGSIKQTCLFLNWIFSGWNWNSSAVTEKILIGQIKCKMLSEMNVDSYSKHVVKLTAKPM